MTHEELTNVKMELDNIDAEICYTTENIDAVLAELTTKLEETTEEWAMRLEWKSLTAFAWIINDYYRKTKELYIKQKNTAIDCLNQIEL